jgi:hypothetical protein
MTKKQLRQHRLKKQAEQAIAKGVKTPNELRNEAFRQLYDEPLDRYGDRDEDESNLD